MDATAWTVVGTAIAILVAIGASFRSLRGEMRAEMREMRGRIDAQGEDLRQRIDAQGEDLRQRIDAQGHDLREQIGQLRERMAHLEGLREGLREAITGKRVA